VTGQSLGGFGVWALIGAFPGRFAAAVPVCGGGNTRKAPSLVHLPIWAFHNAGDPVVWVLESRRMIGALRKAGGSPKYTEYPGGLHNSWDRAYHEPELLPWLFALRNSLTPATTR
ncbi:MAG: phospholipase, partial [Acidobacteria bacterium]|nr:phospholipase [Acidobacteriota bacterium]